MQMLKFKQRTLSDVKALGDGQFSATMYDGSEPDRDDETIDFTGVRVRGAIPAQIDHDHSVLKTVGLWNGVKASGKSLRGVVSFAPPGVSEVADQVRRQVEAGVTTSVSIGFMGTPKMDGSGRCTWTSVEILECSFVSVPASPGAQIDGKALNAWIDASADEPVLDVADELIELPEYEEPEELLDVDENQLEQILTRSVVDTLSNLAKEAAVRTMNQMRGRLD